jgi:type VI secretion system protein ImpG
MTVSDAGEDLLAHYQAELAYLRTAGAAFARRYPRVASALELAPDGSSDPHVQRLIESFAFLTGRLQRAYDAQFPEVPTALLDVLYPQLVAPVPSMSIAAFQPDPQQSRSIAGVTVPAGTTLLVKADQPAGGADALTCRFRTGYNLTLWPVAVAGAWLEPRTLYPLLDAMPAVASVLRIRLQCMGNRRFDEFAPPSLRFFLPRRHGDTREAIYELLFTHLHGIALAPVAAGAAPPDGPAPAASVCGARLAQVGFDPAEGLLPCPPASHQAYRLLQEYFAFPDKFLFFDIADIPPGGFGQGSCADLLLLLDAAPHQPVVVDASSFALGCTPIINLFSRISEPIRLDQTRLEYRLVADMRAESSTEIHSIARVTRSAVRADAAQTVRPLLSLHHTDTGAADTMLYHVRRQPVAHAGYDGTDILLSFVDPDLDPAQPAGDTIFAHVTCTNRGLAEQIIGGTPMALEIDLPVSGVTCLLRPTKQQPPPADGGTLWRLVSHLSANHLSITGGESGAAALREILLLYSAGDRTAMTRRIAGLTALSTRSVVRRIGLQAWRGFCRGTEIVLDFDPQAFVGGNAYLLGSVLSRFFGLYGAPTAFTQLVMQNQHGPGTWRWPAQSGATTLL